MSENGLLRKTLTFGAGIVRGYDVRRDTLTDLSEDQRTLIYSSIFEASKALGALCNKTASIEYSKRILNVPQDHLDKFPSSYKSIEDRISDVEILSGQIKSQVSGGYKIATSQFSKERGKDLMGRGKTRLATFKMDGTLPLYCRADGTRLFDHDGKMWFAACVFSGEWARNNGIPSWIAFQIKIKRRDKTGMSQLRNVASGEWKLCGGQIARNTRSQGGRWLVRISVAYHRVEKNLKSNIVMGIDLGINSPATIHIRDGNVAKPWAFNIGNGREMLAVRGIVKGEICRILRAIKRNDSVADAVTKRMMRDRLRELRKRERRIVKSGCQKVAAQIAKCALENGAGTWEMEDLDLGGLKRGSWMKRNWAVGQLISCIEWNAKKIGAEIVRVNPRNTSKRCNKCGHISSANRPKKKGASVFCCVACGHKDDADKNAARNLSIPNIDKIIAECSEVGS